MVDFHYEKSTSKVENNKNEKLKKLLDSAFLLFTEKGIKKTSIQNIVDHAGVAKGTFYLYFKDKYDLEKHLLIVISHQLFDRALKAANEQNISRLDDKIIFIINYIIDVFIDKPILIHFIQKNLSLGLYSEKISLLMDDQHLGLKDIFEEEVKKRGIDLPHPDITLFMIIELVGSSVFSSIVEKQPVDISEYKPILYRTIKMMINEE